MLERALLARVAAVLLVAATITFFVGATAERSPGQGRGEAPVATRSGGESAEQVACERAGGSEEACARFSEPGERGGAAAREAAEANESPEQRAREGAILGLPLESPEVVAGVAVLSVGLAVVITMAPQVTWLLVGVTVFAVIAALPSTRPDARSWRGLKAGLGGVEDRAN